MTPHRAFLSLPNSERGSKRTQFISLPGIIASARTLKFIIQERTTKTGRSSSYPFRHAGSSDSSLPETYAPAVACGTLVARYHCAPRSTMSVHAIRPPSCVPARTRAPYRILIVAALLGDATLRSVLDPPQPGEQVQPRFVTIPPSSFGNFDDAIALGSRSHRHDENAPSSFGNSADRAAPSSFGYYAGISGKGSFGTSAVRAAPSSFGKFDCSTVHAAPPCDRRSRSEFVWSFAVAVSDPVRPRDTS